MLEKKNDTYNVKDREKLFKYYLSLNEPNTKFYIVRNNKDVDNLINILKS